MNNYLEEKSPVSESLFFQYFNVLKKRRGVVLAFAGVLVITAIIATIISTRYYASQAVIEIMPIAPRVMGNDSVDSLTNLGASSDSSVRMYYGTQFAILSSDTVLQKAIATLQDDHEITDFDEVEEPIQYLRSHMRLSPRPETSLVNIKIEYPDPDKAALFANVIAEVYMENNLERGLKSIEQTMAWLDNAHKNYLKAKQDTDQLVHAPRGRLPHFDHLPFG